MRPEDWRKIHDNYTRLVEELDLKNTTVIDYLYEKNVIGHHDKETLENKQVTKEKNRHFLTLLRSKDTDAYKHFLKALCLEGNQAHVAEWLEPTGPARRHRTSSGKSQVTGKTVADFSVQGLKDWLKPICEHMKIPSSVLDTIEEQRINGKVFDSMSEQDLKENFPELKAFGHRRSLMLAKIEFTKTFQGAEVTESDNVKEKFQGTEFAREFGHEVSEKYHQGKNLTKHVTRSENHVDPVRRFCPCLYVTDLYTTIAHEVAVFSAACLNDKTNGTIYFGISDQSYPDYGYEDGEILGISIDKKECEDTIRLGIKRWFCGEQEVEAAQKCIKPAVFVDVVSADGSEPHNLFVCEVDIEPKSNIVKEFTFDLGSEQDGFDAGVPAKQDVLQMERFSSEKVELTKDGQQQEKNVTSSHKNIMQTLKNYLCGGGDKLEADFCRLLAMPAVNTAFEDLFSFLRHLDLRTIFDFDSKSDETGISHYMEKEKHMVYKIKTPSDFSKTSDQLTQRSSEENDMAQSDLKTWIFCNGYTEADEQGLKIAEWKRDKSTGFKEAVHYYRRTIPEGRAVMVILLTSSDDIFIEACEELLLNFQNQWLMIAESSQIAEAWIDALHKRNVEVDPNRCLYDVSFSEVKRAIEQLQGIDLFSDDACVLNLASGVKELPMRLVHELQNAECEIISTSQCASAESLSADEKAHLRQQKENDFYRGDPPTVWNFYFQGHVCERDKLSTLLRHTRAALEGDVSENENVGCVAVYHQPGAGGTTIAMNVLWHLRDEYPCCVLKRITNDTARLTIELFESVGGIAPVLLMIDDEEDDKIDALKRTLDKVCQNKDISQLVCVMLICLRVMTTPQDPVYKNIFLHQTLSIQEKQFFINKYDELTKTGKENLDFLLGLNIMKENFSESFIKQTVSKFVEVFQHGHERTLLKYTSLLNFFDIHFRPILTSCFDPLMKKFSHGRPWEKNLTPQPLITFTKNFGLSGKNLCLRINGKLLCKYVLDATLQDGQSVGDLMEEFLHTQVFQRASCDFALKRLHNIVRDIMKKREGTGYQRKKFSPFIQLLFEEKKDTSNEQAVRCMITVYDSTCDPMIAQHLARFHMSCNNLAEAEKWAYEATNKWPDNSFLWDTHGQICKTHLSKIRDECEAAGGVTDTRSIVDAVRSAHKGFDTFVKVQELNSQEESLNTAGYFGQMDIILALFQIFKHLRSFQPPDTLQRFLEVTDFVPVELCSDELKTDIPWLKSAFELAEDCLRSVEDLAKTYTGDEYGQSSAKVFLSDDYINQYRQTFAELMGGEDPTMIDFRHLPQSKRQKLIRNLGGHSLYSVMTLCKEDAGRRKTETILQLASLNLKQGNNLFSKKDLNMALASALSLSCWHDHPQNIIVDFGNLLKWSTELYRMNCASSGHYVDLDPFMYLFAFHWPDAKGDIISYQCNPNVLKDAMKYASDNFSKKYRDVSRKRNPPLYFLTKESGGKRVVSKDQLRAWCGNYKEQKISRLLKSTKAMKVLLWYSGILCTGGNVVELTVVTHEGIRVKLHVPLLIQERTQRLWKRRVYFVQSFGTGGPVACEVCEELPSTPKQPGKQNKGGAGADSTTRTRR